MEITLPHNLQSLRPDEEWCVLDYNSDDHLWFLLKERAAPWLESGRLRYYRTLQPRWFDVNQAKNAAHRLARGKVVFNLDADNYIDPNIRDQLARCEEMAGDRYVLHNKSQVRNSPYIPAGDGTYGRIAMPRRTFFDLGGYDEQMLGMGNGDADILYRASCAGLRVMVSTQPPEHPPVPNAVQDKIKHLRPDLRARGFRELNRYHGAFARNRQGVPVLPMDTHLPGVLNFTTYMEDPGGVPSHAVNMELVPPIEHTFGKNLLLLLPEQPLRTLSCVVYGMEDHSTIHIVGPVDQEDRSAIARIQAKHPHCLIMIHSGQPGHTLSRLYQEYGATFSTAFYQTDKSLQDIVYLSHIHMLLQEQGVLQLQVPTPPSEATLLACRALFPTSPPLEGHAWPLVKTHKADDDMLFPTYNLEGVTND